MVLKRTASLVALGLTIAGSLILIGGLFGCGGHERASEVGEEAELSPEDHERAHHALGELQSGRVQEGLAELREISSARPGRGRSVAWMPGAIDIFLSRGDLARADSLLSLVGPVDMRPPELQLLTGRLLVALGDDQRALEAFELCANDPNVGDMALFRAAALHSARGRHEEAASFARRSLEMEPHNDGTRLLLVSALLELDQVDDALRVASDIQDERLRSNAVAHAQLEAGQPAAALRALEASPESDDPLHEYLRGRALGELERHAEAVAILERLAELPYKDSRLLLAASYRALGRDAEAERFEQLERGQRQAERAQTIQRQAEQAVAAGELLQAHRFLRQVVAMDPTNASAHNDLGAVLTRLQRFEEAEGAFLEAERLAPMDAAIPANLAQLYLLMGDPERANEQAIRRQEILRQREP